VAFAIPAHTRKKREIFVCARYSMQLPCGTSQRCAALQFFSGFCQCSFLLQFEEGILRLFDKTPTIDQSCQGGSTGASNVQLPRLAARRRGGGPSRYVRLASGSYSTVIQYGERVLGVVGANTG
jgi:hypothetical protein